MRSPAALVLSAFLAAAAAPGTTLAADCDRVCLEAVAQKYRAAYLAHDRSQAPISSSVRYTENNVELPFPDGTWDTVTQEVGEPLMMSDPKTGSVGFFTAIMQNDTPGFLGVRLRVKRGKIVEIEHMVSTRRNLSSPPTPIGDAKTFRHDPDLNRPPANGKCDSREEMVRLSDGYFSTLEKNTGEIRNTRFSPTAKRFENGMEFPEIEKGFKSGRYAFNERVRDRDYFLVDEHRCLVMSRAYIDHKGVLDQYKLTDGTPMRSIFREPQTWSVLEVFKIGDGMITGVEAVFSAAPYYLRSPWKRDR